jgi:hypothetical protein
MNRIVQEIGHYHYTNSPDELYDIGWKYGPDLSKYSDAVNIIPTLIVLSLFFLPTTDSILKEFLIKFTIIMLVRAMTTISTILPKDESCEHEPSLQMFVAGGCYDKVFSAHTAFVALFTLIFLSKTFITTRLFWLINLVNMAILVFTRGHYTVDVILGFVITYLVYDGKYPFIENIIKLLS